MAKEDNIAAELSGVVGDIMARQVVAVLPKVSAAEAAQQTSAAGVRHAIVVDADRHVLGVVSQRDIFSHFLESLDEPGATGTAETDHAPWEIGSLIKQPPITVSPDVLLCKAGLVLSKYKIDCLPVVDPAKCLVGSLSITELLRHITGKLDAEFEHEFQLFRPEKESRPQKPAFFRRSNGALVLPLSCLEDPACVPGFAMLGYESASRRILLKFIAATEPGARRVLKESDSLVISASDFVAHFDIKFHGTAFEITMPRQPGCLILTPKQPPAVRAPAVAAV